LREYPYGKLFVPDEKGQRAATGGSSSAGATVREQMIAGYIPGRPARQVPPGYGMLVPAGSDLMFQLHYTTNGKAVRDRTKGRLYLREAVAGETSHSHPGFQQRFRYPSGSGQLPGVGRHEAGNGV
jgi:hypothetical protein